MPIRLGEDVFLKGRISYEKKVKLAKSMKAFKLLMDVFGAVDYSTVFATASDLARSALIIAGLEFDVLTVICVFLFVGAVGKSAQIGLHT